MRILVLDLLDILRKYSDKNHPLTQQRIIDILERKYSYESVRGPTIADNLRRILYHYELYIKDDLDYRKIRLSAEEDNNDYEIGDIDETKRRITNIYYNHKFSRSELLMLIDSILFSKNVRQEDRENLIKKLESLYSKNFNSRMGNINSMSMTNKKDNELRNKEVFHNIIEIDRAITQSKKISFNYLQYKVEGRNINQVIKKNSQGEDRNYKMNPYYMVASNGRYYLICNNDKYENVSHYRIDRITNIDISDEERKSKREVKGLGENFNLNDYMAENIYMFGGKSEYIELELEETFLDEFMEWFNLDEINIKGEKKGKIIVRVKSNSMAMRKWALRYSLYVRVLSPKGLVEDIKNDLRNAMSNYDIL